MEDCNVFAPKPRSAVKADLVNLETGVWKVKVIDIAVVYTSIGGIPLSRFQIKY